MSEITLPATPLQAHFFGCGRDRLHTRCNTKTSASLGSGTNDSHHRLSCSCRDLLAKDVSTPSSASTPLSLHRMRRMRSLASSLASPYVVSAQKRAMTMPGAFGEVTNGSCTRVERSPPPKFKAKFGDAQAATAQDEEDEEDLTQPPP